MIVNFWPHWFRKLYGGEWPRSYCAVDTETSGYSPTEDVVTQWGHCLVEDGKVVDRLSLVIDWSDRDVPPDWWLQRRLSQVEWGMRQAGKTCHMTYERTRGGKPPEKAFAFIRKFTETIKAKQIPFVLHGGVFDEKMLSANFLAHKFGPGFSFGDYVLDTEGIEKASQLTDHERVHPKKGDTLRAYFHRVKYTRAPGVKSNLDDHCFKKYALAEAGVAFEGLHDAYEDAYCCHLLMEKFGRLVTDPVVPPDVRTADQKASFRSTPQPPPIGTSGGGRRIRGQRRS